MKKQEDSDHFVKVTECYYSRILGTSDNLFAHNYLKPFFFYTPIRNAPLQGYEHRFDLLAIQTEQGIIISYGDAVLTEIPKLEMALESDTVSLHEAISRILKKEPSHSYKYYFSGRIPKGFSARPLNASDYSAFETFFLLSNANMEDKSWLREYFHEMIREGLCTGVFVNNVLVSCSDSPTVPFMKDSVREIGINTLERYRRQGYAKDACSCAIQEILKQGKCPIWSTGSDNLPSQRLAEALGFRLFGEMFSISMDNV